MSTPETNSIIEILGVAVKQAELQHDENSEINFRRAFEKVRLLETERDDYQLKAFDIAKERDELRNEIDSEKKDHEISLMRWCDDKDRANKTERERDELRAEVERLKADKVRLENAAHGAINYVGSANYSERIRDAHKSIDAAMKGAE